MPIQSVIEILKAYQRYVDYMNDHGFDEIIESIKENWTSLLITMRGHMGETYEMEVYFSGITGELCIESSVTHVIADILCDVHNETEDCQYEFKGIKIWLSR